jgi:putative sterol carrier protein
MRDAEPQLAIVSQAATESRGGSTATTDATTDFFESLARRGHEQSLEQTRGTLRVELSDDDQLVEHWLVSIDAGDIDVAHRNAPADCTLRASREIFKGLATGEVNAFAAFLRGAVVLEGDSELLVKFQRLFPGPPGTGARTRTNEVAGAAPG